MYRYTNRPLGQLELLKDTAKEAALALITPEVEDLSYRLSRGVIGSVLTTKKERVKPPEWVGRIIQEEIAPGLNQTVSKVSQGIMREILPSLILTVLVTGVGFGWLQFKMLESIKLRQQRQNPRRQNPETRKQRRRCYGCKKLVEKGEWYKHSSGVNIWFCSDCSYEYKFDQYSSGALASVPFNKVYPGYSGPVPRKPTLEEYDTRPRRFEWEKASKSRLIKRRDEEADAELERKGRK